MVLRSLRKSVLKYSFYRVKQILNLPNLPYTRPLILGTVALAVYPQGLFHYSMQITAPNINITHEYSHSNKTGI